MDGRESEEFVRNFSDRTENYKVCQIHGEYLTSIHYLPKDNDHGRVNLITHYCKQCERERLQRERWGRAEIPKRFQGKRYENYSLLPDGGEEQAQAMLWVKEFIAHIPDRLEAGTSAIFYGNPGTGKTHLACAIATECAEQGYEALFTSIGRMARDVSASWKAHDTSAFSRYIALDLLVIDEISEGNSSEFERNLLFQVVNERYENCRSTILLTNVPASGLVSHLGAKTIDRVRENGGRVLRFGWKSYRGSDFQKNEGQ